MRFNREFDSNEMDESSESICDRQHQAEKHFRKQIFDCRTRSNSSTNSPHKMLIHRLIELEKESQLTEVMIRKMHPIQFGGIVNLIKNKLSETCGSR
jgi:hypothetical protein